RTPAGRGSPAGLVNLRWPSLPRDGLSTGSAGSTGSSGGTGPAGSSRRPGNSRRSGPSTGPAGGSGRKVLTGAYDLIADSGLLPHAAGGEARGMAQTLVLGRDVI